MPRKLKAPVITIIVAVRNGERTLQRCIDSAIAQNYANKELIIFDGGSTDGTQNILQANNDKIAYWRSEPDRGVYHAWNKALDHARGEWICFLGDDDVFASCEVLGNVAQLLRDAYPKYRIVYGRVNLVNAAGKVLDTIGSPWAQARKRFLQGFNIPHPGAMHHRSIFLEHGRFNERFYIAADYELLLRELRVRDALFVGDVITVNMLRGGMSTKPENFYRLLRAAAAARKKNEITSVSIPLIGKTMLAWVGWRVNQVLGPAAFNCIADGYRLLTGRKRVWTRQ